MPFGLLGSILAGPQRILNRIFLEPAQSGGTPPALTLGTLALSSTSATAGAPWSATISNQTGGSSLSVSSSDGTALTLSGTTVSGIYASAGSPTVTLTETLASATNSPKSTAVSIAVAAAPPSGGTGSSLDFSDPANSGLHPGL